MVTLPTLFVSHGAPDLLLHPEEPAYRFLAGLGASLPRPRALLVISAHWQAVVASVAGGAHPATVHDFGGFDPALHRIHYPAPGAPELATRVLDLLRGWTPQRVARGWDHGVWAPLRLLYPQADLPVLQIALLRTGGPAVHLRLGAALTPLRDEGVLIIGSGSATHNLAALGTGQPPAWATGFEAWLVARAEAGDAAALCDYRRAAPFAAENHPSEEHLLPLFAALGAAGPGAQGRVLHRSFTYAALSMASLAFTA